MSEPKLAVQLFTVREFIQTEQALAEALRRLREIGYRAVEVGVGSLEQARQMAKCVEAEGMTVCASHPGILRFKDADEVQAVVEELQVLKTSYAVSPYVPPEFWSAEGYARFADILTLAGRRFAEAGIAISHHNHSIEFQHFDGRPGLEILFEKSDPACVFAELDTYWVQYAGGDPAAWIRRLGPRAKLVHLKDMAVQERDPLFAPVGEGNMNWPAILEACREVGTEWVIVEQDRCQRDPFDCLASSYRYLKDMGIQ